MIDSHCHLADAKFAGDLDAVVARAKQAGLERVCTILEAGNAPEAAQAGRLIALWPEVRFAIGVHPHQAHEFAAEPDRAVSVVRAQLSATPAARAVGEIGLDYHYDFSPRDAQHTVFRRQVRLARELRRPVVVHTREADADTIRILREEGDGEVRGVHHQLDREEDRDRIPAQERPGNTDHEQRSGREEDVAQGDPARDHQRVSRRARAKAPTSAARSRTDRASNERR